VQSAAETGIRKTMPEKTGENARPEALLIGENPQGCSYLAKRLQERGCACSFAASHQGAYLLLVARKFDLVLSPMRLRDTSFFFLMQLLAGSDVTLFYSHAVEDSCWWLPALRHGEICFGAYAFRPSDFIPVLDEAIAEVRRDRRLVGIATPSPGWQSPRQFVVKSDPPRESLPAGPVHAMTSAMVKHKAAG